MFQGCQKLLSAIFLMVSFGAAQEIHHHNAHEKLGTVSFPISCKADVRAEFNRGIALLHSFAYAAAGDAFRQVAKRDPDCAMAHWGSAMAFFRQLWEPAILPDTIATADAEIDLASRIGAATDRERKFIRAAASLFHNASTVPYSTRVRDYEHEMAALANENNKDVEAKLFYALALLANVSPADKTHSKQKLAADILEPLYRAYPQHPGIAHYLIHAYDNAELAARGLPMARAYSKIAPSAPHALHMPSHIFTRLGLWDDSIASNSAAKDAARKEHDIGEELHSMDYLVYAYLQSGREPEAAHLLQQLRAMPKLNTADFKIGYASTAMPIRYFVERQKWADAAAVVAPVDAPPHVIAIAIWAQGLGLARSGHAAETDQQISALQQIEEKLRVSGNTYWSSQVRVMKREVMAWSAQAQSKGDDAVALLRQAADEEDATEKLPVTPGPIVPAREQLGDLLLQQGHAVLAATEFQAALANAPGRRGALRGASEAAKQLAKR
jgi:tetratricopeptide (TPR) repeat protein